MPEHLYAVLADIHANFSALTAVAEDAHQEGRKRGLTPEFICLGDVVDYGPQPNQCVEWMRKHQWSVLLRGNHDDDATKPGWAEPTRVDKAYWPITLWTRFALKPSYQPLLAEWPDTKRGSNSLGAFLCFHGYPDDNTPNIYIGDPGNASGAFSTLTRLSYTHGLYGHSHHQIMYTRCIKDGRHGERVESDFALGCHEHEGPDARHVRVNVGWQPFPVGCQVLLNPGSVGQPRCHAEQLTSDWRAAYALLYSDGSKITQFQWRRVVYPIEETVAQLEKLAWLDGPKQDRRGAGADVLKETERLEPIAAARLSSDQIGHEERLALKDRFDGVKALMIRVLKQGK